MAAEGCLDTMKVLLNIEALIPPLTGIGCYTQQLLQGLLRNGQCEVSCFFDYKIFACQEVPVLSPPLSSLTHYAKIKRFVRHIPGAYELRSMLRDFFFAQAIKNTHQDVLYHEPNYILKPFPGPAISTIHDLSWLHYPQFHPKERIRYMEREMPKALRRATHFITDSDYVKNEIVSLLGVAPERITTIPLGVSERFYPRPQSECRTALEKNGLSYGGYLLAVATLEPRKNFTGLLDAFELLPAPLRQRFPLVVVGGKGWRSHSLERRLERLERCAEVRLLGYVAAEELPLIYAGARAFAFPSYYEGFGLPPLEAMASGIPVLVADNSAMSEVVAEAGLKVEARDPEAISAGLQRLLLDDDFRAGAVAEGRRRAEIFTWQRCVEKTIEVYRMVGGH